MSFHLATTASTPAPTVAAPPLAEAPARPTIPAFAPATSAMKILVAEDEPVSRRVLQAALARLGHTCVVTRDGNEAWDAYHAFRPDVIISDRSMPGMDGQSLCQKVRQSDADRKRYTYFVLLTGMTDRADILSGMKAGADDYLAKPLDPTQLEARLIAAERVTSLHRDMLGLHETLWALARRDMLTGLFNRLQLKEDLDVLREHIVRTQKSWTVALCDVDHFKAYNDHYGHLQGDEALRRVAEALQGEGVGAFADPAQPSGPSADLLGPLTVYRYGGEEFCLLVDSDGPDAVNVLEAARARVAACAIPHAQSQTAPYVTVSIGLSPLHANATAETNALLADADDALYAAKRAGRNRVAAADA